MFTHKYLIVYFDANGKQVAHAGVNWSFKRNNITDAWSKLRGLRDTGGPGALPGLPRDQEGWLGYILIERTDGSHPAKLILPNETPSRLTKEAQRRGRYKSKNAIR